MLLQKLAMPPAAAQATIVLPAFTQSLPADEETQDVKILEARKPDSGYEE